MSELKPLVIGDLVVEKPIIQGGMGVGISLHRLAGAVTSCTETLDQPFFNHRVWHMGGVLARESVDLLQDFFAGRRD